MTPLKVAITPAPKKLKPDHHPESDHQDPTIAGYIELADQAMAMWSRKAMPQRKKAKRG